MRTATAAIATDDTAVVCIEHGGETVYATEATWTAACDALIAKHGAGVPRVSRASAAPVAPIKALSTWTETVVDADAKKRIEAQHAALIAGGVNVDVREQYFATGTRMAAEGYTTQEARRVEHDAQGPVRDAAEALSAAVTAERRADVVVTSRELAQTIHANGRITALGGLRLSEQAIRGICSRIKSPALGYLLGLRERLAAEVAKGSGSNNELIARTKAQFVSALATELWTGDEMPLKLRTRGAQRDIFAVVSPSYTPADAPEVVAQVIDGLPADARGSWAYDAKSTTWELRASVWTPTPVAEQAVGEAFEGYARFGSRDNGTGRFNGGGGVTMLRCLNASTYVATGHTTSRVHRGGVLVDVARMLAESVGAIDTLCAAWGVARATPVVLPDEGSVSIEEALPGYWRWLLTDRESELAVLPGRTETHALALAAIYPSERRDPSRLVRSDLAQTFTRYVQDQPADVRRDAERAVGAWLAEAPKKIGCIL